MRHAPYSKRYGQIKNRNIMRKALIIIISICITSNLISQDYIKFPTSDALWNFKIIESINPPYEWTIIDSLGQKITIDNQEYIEVHIGSSIVGAIRDDTVTRKVYFHNNNNETILYDFSVNVGDTVFYNHEDYNYYKTVEYISYVDINGQQRKMFHLLNSLFDMPDYWIEGIGSVYRYGLLNPLNPGIVMDGSTPYFGCFTHDTISYFVDSTCLGDCPCTDWLVEIMENINSDTEIVIFPNPTKNVLTIEFLSSINHYESFEIFSCLGELVLNQEFFNERQIEINLEFLSKGIYYIRLNGVNRNSMKKFIKE